MRDLYIALDFKTEPELWDFMENFQDQSAAFKVGMSQFYMSGPEIVWKLAAMGHKVFLDLKCHDIPNTVYLAMRQLSQLPVELITVHTLGGPAMLKAAVKGAKEGPYQPKVLGITQLTSTDQNMLTEDLHIQQSVEESVLDLAQMAQKTGLDGVVSSALEVKKIKAATNGELLALTPGIRLAEDTSDDQSRVASPSQAKANGADYIVVGRPITQAKDPLAAYQNYLKEWQGE
ncbi:orotidine-5'-phosphate decarboxylase [Aerococcus kribbianus]|uniref:Orotidine 5'-phosphate decarboxylase n=1 Tax=Aerococcus kribbianus TaxID=2999064 RepID=A0A9X3JCW2_9LACT|nr:MULTISPECIES: orotidine-5'-phosphate decarboxylase [unclassified Aerococcus]MCZ0716885.1 orotidine-5'-phosphate decarboxylase [Aerococcus sp. YH-aer221]MCZ0725173.1 orotidine-5'-phosphate decarboxylase [Aerococcus sp. YH-aer222]